jgi:hypothetical protein
MKVTRILVTLLALTAAYAGTAAAQPCARYSWNACETYVPNQMFGAPGIYKGVISLSGVSDPNVGTDSFLRMQPGPIPDAWRFDENATGCNTPWDGGSNSTNAAFSKNCPAMKGLSPLASSSYFVDANGVIMHLGYVFDTFAPVGTTRYTIWNLNFDHSFSETGPGNPPSTCGGAEKGLNFYLELAVLRQSGGPLPIPVCDQIPGNPGAAATWQGGVPPVPAQSATWGKLKGLYR